MKWLDMLRRTNTPAAQEALEPPATDDGVLPVETAACLPEPSLEIAAAPEASAPPEVKSSPDATASYEDSLFVSRLSPREREIFQRLLSGAKMKDIARELNIRTSTVNGYVSGIYRLLGVHSKAELIIRYAGLYGDRKQGGD